MLRRPGPPLRIALLCLVGLALTGVIALLVPLAQARDSVTLQGFVGLNQPEITPLIERVAHLADPRPYALIGFALALIAVSRGRVRLALLIPVVLVAAGATTTLLKPLLATPRYDEWLGDGQIMAASWPSGHASASMTLGLLAVLAMPPRLRPTAAAAGGAFAISVSYAILSLGWHFPSDVIGGFLNAAMWVALLVATLAALEQRRPERRPRWAVVHDGSPRPVDAIGPIALGAGGAAMVAAIAISHPGEIAEYALRRPTWTLGAVAIAGLAGLLAAALARALGQAASR
ncbi:phosphatase PAP2 family protein [Paraconexibacter sp.]|uniref:phosphatase PAP2 family protein n=1 Tax=Paraconexibacter sp. TaxID=2949640 RepID=UPI003567BDCD